MARYIEVYEYYKDLIISGQMEPEMKLPSIRKGADQLNISRTTMENAYMLLAAEGYIISHPQSGYYVTDMAKKKKENMETRLPKKREAKKILYDFASSNVDKESFKFEVWRRYMKSALRQDEKLLSYGEPQGELEFREVLADYIRETRNVVCAPEQIVIGAGVQSLLHILCPIIKDRKVVSFHNPGYIQGCSIFEDYGFEFSEHRTRQGVYYVSPSQMSGEGGVMSITKRRELLVEAQEKDCLIIEDDYNSEFKYFQKPTPSVQGLAGGKGVVYIGTFSKMLLPSIRMSYMVLPPELLPAYEMRKSNYNQTASKAEQIALTQFIRDGHLAGQIRKSRKIHMAKSEELRKVILEIFGEDVAVKISESGFHVHMIFSKEIDTNELEKRAKEQGIAITVLKKNTLMLTSANVAMEDYKKAIFLLKEVFINRNI